jgi:hypothetical protein
MIEAIKAHPKLAIGIVVFAIYIAAMIRVFMI